MSDHLTPEQRRRCMQANRSKGTRPERLLARELWHRGYRYRKNVRGLPGTPDICFKSRKVAVFVDGDFWHGRDWDHAKQRIKSNRAYWYAKIERNILRDRRDTQRLAAMGWTVLRFWEGDVLHDLPACVAMVEEVLRVEQLQHLRRLYQYDTQYDTPDLAAEEEPDYE